MNTIILFTPHEKALKLIDVYTIAFSLHGKYHNPFKDSIINMMQQMDTLMMGICSTMEDNLVNSYLEMTDDDYVTFTTLTVKP